MKKVIKVIFTTIFIMLVITIILISIPLFLLHNKLGEIQYDEISQNEIVVTEEVTNSEVMQEHRNIAIFGIDARTDTYQGARSDGIMIASIDNTEKTIKLVSVYRDSYLEIPGEGLDKVTHAYAYGGPTLAMNTLNRNLDLNIKEEVTVNFEATKTIVDEIGGIEIDIQSDEIKHIDGIDSVGTYNLNGEQALSYARIRKEAGGDYKRTERMRTVLMAIFEKIKTLSLPEQYQIVEKMLPHVSTNISTTEIMSMIPKMASYKFEESLGWPYEVKGITLDRWYGVPVTLEENVVRLHQEIFEEEGYEASSTVKEISDKIIKKTNYR